MKTRYALLTALALTLPLTGARASTFTWTGASTHPDHWYNVTNWSPWGVPGGGDTIILPDSTPPAPFPALAFSDVRLAGGSLGGSPTLAGSLVWTAGTVAGSLTVAGTGTIEISGTVRKVITGLVRSEGSVLLIGDAALDIAPGGRLVNLPGGVVESQGNNAIAGYIWGWNCGTMDNQGVLQKTGGTHSGIAVPLSSSGIVRALTGMIELSCESLSPMGVTSGTLEASAGTMILLRNFALNPGVQLTGPGAHRLIGGRLNGSAVANLDLAGGNVVVNGDVTLGNTLLSESTLVSSNGVLHGELDWVGGGIGTGDPLVIAAGAQVRLSGTVRKVLSGRLHNSGNLTLTGGTTLDIAPGGVLLNLPTGVVESQGNDSIAGYIWGWNYGTMTNQGVLRKTGGTTTGIAVPLDSSGIVRALAGTIELSCESLNPMGVACGSLEAAAGTAILLRNFALNPGTQFTGPGAHRLIGGRLNGGTITNLDLAGGNVVVNGEVTFGNTLLTESTLVSSNGVLHGELDWVGGAIGAGDPLRFATDAVVRLSGPGSIVLSGVVSNAGTIQLTGTAKFQISGRLHNGPGGVVDSQGDNFFTGQIWDWNSGPILNEGLLVKSGGSGTTTVGLQLDNTGEVRADHGTLALQRGSGGGEFVAGAGAAITYGGYVVLDGVRFLGRGTNAVIGSCGLIGTAISSNLVIAGGSLWPTNATLAGVLHWQAGSLATGTNHALRVAPLSVVRLDGSGSCSVGCLFSNAGTVRLSGSAALAVNPAGWFVNGPAGLVELQDDASLTGDIWSWNVGRLDNLGQLRKTGGTGTSRLEPPVNNSGLLDVQFGTLQLPANTTLAGGQVRCSLRGASDYGRVVLAGAVPLAGTLSAELVGGYTPAPGTQFEVISASSLSGAFTGLDLPDHFFQTNSATSVFLVVGSGGPVSLSPPKRMGTNCGFAFQSEAGLSYTVERNDDLRTANWTLVQTISGDGALKSFLAPVADAPQRFFRVKQP
jgi:hypothetical protein